MNEPSKKCPLCGREITGFGTEEFFNKNRDVVMILALAALLMLPKEDLQKIMPYVIPGLEKMSLNKEIDNEVLQTEK